MDTIPDWVESLQIMLHSWSDILRKGSLREGFFIWGILINRSPRLSDGMYWAKHTLGTIRTPGFVLLPHATACMAANEKFCASKWSLKDTSSGSTIRITRTNPLKMPPPRHASSSRQPPIWPQSRLQKGAPASLRPSGQRLVSWYRSHKSTADHSKSAAYSVTAQDINCLAALPVENGGRHQLPHRIHWQEHFSRPPVFRKRVWRFMGGYTGLLWGRDAIWTPIRAQQQPIVSHLYWRYYLAP